MKILFVCTGNTCRSPMAEGIFLSKYKKDGDECLSAGLYTKDDSPASPNAIQAMEETGIDISAHRSKTVTADDINNSDLIIAMTESHAEMLKLLGADAEKITVLNVCDPFGGDLDEYRKCRDEIDKRLKEIFNTGD
ncbi:MAG: low molecular weight protein arginine phosphatase [Clostridiales bacterium]|nr:low molecular weight protein arginine phosphatase [Clostridiales bacterium]